MNPKRPKVTFVSTAIPYVNAAPHLGYAFEAVIADSIARYRRSTGCSVHHQAGTDDNSLKNAHAAEAASLTTRELVDQNAARFHALGNLLGLSWDAFVRTSSDPQHQRNVVEIWERCRRRGDIYTATYTGFIQNFAAALPSRVSSTQGAELHPAVPCSPKPDWCPSDRGTGQRPRVRQRSRARVATAPARRLAFSG